MCAISCQSDTAALFSPAHLCFVSLLFQLFPPQSCCTMFLWDQSPSGPQPTELQLSCCAPTACTESRHHVPAGMQHYNELLEALIPESHRKDPELGLSFNKLSCCSTPKQLSIHPTWREDIRPDRGDPPGLAQGTGGLLGARGSPAAWPDWASSSKPPRKARAMERSGKAPPRLLHHLTASCSAPGSLALGTELHVSLDFEQQGPSCPSKRWAPHLSSLMSSKTLTACLYSKLQGIPASGTESSRTKMHSLLCITTTFLPTLFYSLCSAYHMV